jgi:dihydrofolate reductase
MRTLGIVESVTLDGVMQAPAGKDEDTRGGFEHGGWAQPYNDEVIGREMGKGMGKSELLFGRRTYEQFASFWPNAPKPNPFSDILAKTPKYVVSRTLEEPLPWENSTLLEGDARDAVARLKDEPGDDLVILGSGELVRSLMSRGLIDEYTLLIHPLVLGSGRRLFADDGSVAPLKLVTSVESTKGVLINTYRPA